MASLVLEVLGGFDAPGRDRAAAEDCLHVAAAAADMGDLRVELVARSAACLPLIALDDTAEAVSQGDGLSFTGSIRSCVFPVESSA